MALQRGGERIVVFRDTVTVFNIIPQHGRESEKLQRTVLDRVFWDGTSGIGFTKTGAAKQDTTTVIIPFRSSYMMPARWFDSGCPADSFTLQPGDIIVRGAVDDENTTPAELQKKYGGDCCITIQKAHNCCFGSKNMWHWEVTGV